MTDAYRLAAKAFIVNVRDEVLLVKRRPNDAHKPGVWEIPGGRLEIGEDPRQGLRREVREEVGIDVALSHPLRVHHFTREDGQRITMIVFLCTPQSQDVRLSEEHTEHRWVAVSKAGEVIVPEFAGEVDLYRQFFQGMDWSSRKSF